MSITTRFFSNDVFERKNYSVDFHGKSTGIFISAFCGDPSTLLPSAVKNGLFYIDAISHPELDFKHCHSFDEAKKIAGAYISRCPEFQVMYYIGEHAAPQLQLSF